MAVHYVYVNVLLFLICIYCSAVMKMWPLRATLFIPLVFGLSQSLWELLISIGQSNATLQGINESLFMISKTIILLNYHTTHFGKDKISTA